MSKTPDEKTDILLITPHLPAESGHGASMRVGAHLEILARQHRVHLHVITQSDESPDETGFVKKYATSIHYWKAPRALTPNANLPLIIDSINPLPSLVREYPVDLAKKISESVPNKTKIQKVHIFRLSLAAIGERITKILGVPKARFVVDMDDYESESATRNLAIQQALLGKTLSFFRRIDIIKIKIFEKRIATAAGCIYLCSEIDKAKFLKNNPLASVKIIQNTYRIPTKTIPTNKTKHQKTILFIGSLNYTPNIDAIDYFINSIWNPYLKFYGHNLIIAGRHPPKSITKICIENQVTLIANPPDMEPIYSNADLIVVPIRTGGGTRIKILEAFAYGRPVVSTSIGAEGINVHHGIELILADNPLSFSDACLNVLNDEHLANQLVISGRKLLDESYSLDSIAKNLLMEKNH